jgi:hypothetical protein
MPRRGPRLAVELLAKVRADLSGQDLPALTAIPALQTEAVFRQQYGKMLDQVSAVVAQDPGVDLTKKVGTGVGAAVAEKIAVRILTAVATRLGASAGIMAVGTTSGAATFGIGLVAAIVLDITVDWLLKVAGYDPEGQVAAKVNGTLDGVGYAPLRGR